MTTYRQMAQRARRDRERLSQSPHIPITMSSNGRLPRPTHLLPVARRPLLPRPANEISFRHCLGHCDVICSLCHAEHWLEERVQGSSLWAPKFSTCCMGGTITMEKFQDPPLPLYSLLVDDSPCMFSVDIFVLTISG